MKDRLSHLFTVDQLRAAGALDVPPAWRKSLNDEQPKGPWLFGDDDVQPTSEPADEAADAEDESD